MYTIANLNVFAVLLRGWNLQSFESEVVIPRLRLSEFRRILPEKVWNNSSKQSTTLAWCGPHLRPAQFLDSKVSVVSALCNFEKQVTFWLLWDQSHVCSAFTKLSTPHSLLLGTAPSHFQLVCLLDLFFKAYHMNAQSTHSSLHHLTQFLIMTCACDVRPKLRNGIENWARHAKYTPQWNPGWFLPVQVTNATANWDS